MLTSVGIGTEPVWEAIKNGRNGIGPITAFDATGFNCRIAGEVKGFDPGDYIEKKEIKKMGRFIQFAIAATEFALQAFGLQGESRGSRAHRRVHRQRHRRIRSHRARAQDPARKRPQPHLAVFHSGDHHQPGVGLRFDPHRREGSELGHRDGLHHQRAFHRRFVPHHPARRRRRDDLRRRGSVHHADGRRRIRRHAGAVAAQ